LCAFLIACIYVAHTTLFILLGLITVKILGTCTGERRDAYRVLMGKPAGRRPLGRFRHRNGFLKREMRGMDLIDLAQDRDRWWAVVDVVMNLQIPQNAEYFVTS
jgi:hypothetical protein